MPRFGATSFPYFPLVRDEGEFIEPVKLTAGSSSSWLLSGRARFCSSVHAIGIKANAHAERELNNLYLNFNMIVVFLLLLNFRLATLDSRVL